MCHGFVIFINRNTVTGWEEKALSRGEYKDREKQGGYGSKYGGERNIESTNLLYIMVLVHYGQGQDVSEV